MALRKVSATLVGAAFALMPALVAAQEQSRALGATGDFWRVALFTLLGLGGVLVVAALGYLYRRERGLGWEFQKPDAGDGEVH
ncbi:MAG TPA: hypothetical protein QGI71_03365 [Dehalococcoidia bacterium]|jgi:ABC-type transporter lipoprotein component MlaA|nr:hypothetical protein [Dehalococcoidia bacterium]